MLMDDTHGRTTIEKCGIDDKMCCEVTLLAHAQGPAQTEEKTGEFQAVNVQSNGSIRAHNVAVNQDVPTHAGSITREDITNTKTSTCQASQLSADQAASSDLSITESSMLTDLTSRRPFKPSSSKRQQLIGKEAVEIYLLRPKTKAGKLLRRGSMAHCKVRDMQHPIHQLPASRFL